MDVWYDGSHGISFYELAFRGSISSVIDSTVSPLGKFIGHTARDWDLVPLSNPFFAPPSQKVSTIEIPGANGILDVTDELTKWPLYNNRQGSWSFYCAEYFRYEELLDYQGQAILDNGNDPILASVLQTWAEKYSMLMNKLHGKRVAIVLDDDPNYFYYGRVEISQWANSNDGKTPNGFVLNYDVYPYKFQCRSINADGTRNWNSSFYELRGQGGNIRVRCGRYPVVPSIWTKRQSPNLYGNDPIYLRFTNKELGIDCWNIPWNSNSRKCEKLENIATGAGPVTFLLSNLSGDNTCIFSISHGNGVVQADDTVNINFWTGEL